MKIRKKLISLGLAVAMIATPACSVLENFGVHVDLTTLAATQRHDVEKDHQIQNQADLIYACTKKGGKYTITKDITVTQSISVTTSVTLVNSSNDHVISTTSSIPRIFYVNGGNLTLGSSINDACRVVVRGGTHQGQAYVETAPIVIAGGTVTINKAWIWCSKKVAFRVTKGGHLIMNGGEIKKIQNSNKQSGAVLLSPNSNSDFTMNGGEIKECNVGGVMVGSGCTFNMNGGSISKNTDGAGNPSVTPNLEKNERFTGFGGGVYNAGTFNMNGGSISGNSATTHGGGVYNVGNFTMSNGTISDNQKGGVFNLSSFTMRNGSITGNNDFGGVYNKSNFGLSGGTISNNINNSERAGNSVFNKENANMYVSGNISLGNDVAAFGGAKLSITGPVSSSIPVTLENPTLGTTVVYTPGAAGNDYVKAINVTNLPRGCFLAGDGDRVVISQDTKVSYDLDGDGIADEGRSMNVTYNSPFTVETYESILEKVKNLSKYRYFDLDKEYMQSGGSNIAYGQTINPTGDVLLSVKWTPKKFTVTYDYNGGKSTSGQESHFINTDYEKGFTVDFDNVPVREGYEFLGWSTKKDATEATYKETALEKNYYSDVTLYAVWEARGIIITYDTGSGSAIQATVGTTENPPVVTAIEPTREGYTFVGWYDEAGNKAERGNSVPNSITLTARWVEPGQWDVALTRCSSSKINIRKLTNTTATTYTALKKPLTMTVSGVRSNSQGSIPATKYQYQIVDKGKTFQLKASAWNEAIDGKITISDHSDCRIYIKAVAYEGKEFSDVYESNGFSIDTKAPIVSGVKNGKIYKKAVTIRVSDQVSGVKKITLNGKKIKSGHRIKKKGVYKLVATDNSGHKKVIRFAIRK